MNKNKFMKAFLMLITAAAVTFGVSGCGKKTETEAQTVQKAKPSLPSLDVEDAKSVVEYYAACLATGEYTKASGIAKKDGLEIVKMLQNQPDSKQSKEYIAAFETITKSFDSVLQKDDEDKGNGHRHTFRFQNVKPVKKIGVKMEGGQYWVVDL